ncbi:MAG TPA: aryl-sulfate sulfotransferase [Acidobacteriaceae bacterium]|nr:aryl-sulfate sulfotransferase [Acidobacteriaceae bacterium]
MRPARLALFLPLVACGCSSISSPTASPNFTVAAAPTTLALQSGGAPRALTVTVNPVDGFASPVTVALSGLPTGITASPATLSVAPGQLAQFQLSAAKSTPTVSSAPVTVMATSGTMSSSAVATLAITSAPTPDFSLAASPTSLSLQAGGSARSVTVTVDPVNGFTDPVSVSLTGLPAGVTATPATVSVTPGQLAQFQVSASKSAATTSSASITVTGADGSLSHTAATALAITSASVPDFSLTSAPTAISLQAGGSARSVTVTVDPVNGFTDPVSVSLTGLPAGVTATPATVSVTPGQLAQFQVSASKSAATTSSASITVTGADGSLTHTAATALAITSASVPDFSLTSAPAALSLQAGGTPRSFTVTVNPVNGFTDPVSVSLTGLPAGVTATPASLSVAPGQLAQFQLSAASSTATTSSASITVTGADGSLTHTGATPLAITAAANVVSNASLSATSYDFGGNLVGSTLTKTVVTVTNTGTAAVTLNPSVSGDPSYSIAAGSCGTSLAAGASCSESVSYAPTTASGSTPQTATLNLGLGNVPAGTAQTVSLTGISAVLAQGTVTSSNNPQVALYTMTLPFPGSVTVNFGKDTNYGLQTWTQSTTQAGGSVSIYVAGMQGNTAYHMQASVQLQNGISATDIDHTFTTGKPLLSPNLTVTTTAGLTPQSGLEELTLLAGSMVGIATTDLQGNVVWSYTLPNSPSTDDIEGVKQLPNGNFVIGIGQGSSYPIISGSAPGPGTVVAIREIDLAGNIVREISAADLTDELKAAGYNIILQQFHHEVTPLPNGHILVLANTTQTFTNLPGYPGNTNVLGDVIIDLDQNLQPAWVWNEFDHFDVNRHPMQFPDWTHTNAIVYSPDDHNILVSIRHQNWVVKVDYEDGAGSGKVLWRLGEGGDFTLQGGTDPTDWQYAQHMPHIVGPTSAGIFSLILMDNGDDRIFPDGGQCGTGSEPACYSTIPVFQINETAMTATLTFHQILPTSLYNFWGGNAEQLANGNYEYDISGLAAASDIFEITPDNTNPTTVWHMHLSGANAYRGFRVPSMYPGVQW